MISCLSALSLHCSIHLMNLVGVGSWIELGHGIVCHIQCAMGAQIVCFHPITRHPLIACSLCLSAETLIFMSFAQYKPFPSSLVTTMMTAI